MNIIKVLLVSFFFISICACSTKKNNAIKEKAESEIVMDSISDELIKDGFKKAIIVFSDQKEAPCKYLMQIENDLLIEPLHELEESFKIGELPVWVKYHPQRRMSRCSNAQPVEIISLKKR